MKWLVAIGLYATWAPLRLLVLAFVGIASACIRIGKPIARSADWCLDRAREWDPRLWERDQHTDLRPPPGA